MVFDVAYLMARLHERIALVHFKPDQTNEPQALKHYRDRPDLRACPAQILNNSYAVRIRSSRNTKQQRPKDVVHVANRVEIQIARRVTGKDYSNDEGEVFRRAEQLISAFLERTLGAYEATWEDTTLETSADQQILFCTIVLTCSAFWNHSSQYSS